MCQEAGWAVAGLIKAHDEPQGQGGREGWGAGSVKGDGELYGLPGWSGGWVSAERGESWGCHPTTL